MKNGKMFQGNVNTDPIIKNDMQISKCIYY